MNQATGENAALIEFAKANLAPPEQRTLTHDGLSVPYLVTKGGQVKGLADLVDRERMRPRLRAGTAKFEAQSSFEAHVNRFKSEHSTLWATRGDASHPQLVAVLDYHEKGHDGLPALCKHQGSFDFPLSEEWEAWHGQNEQPMSQYQFALFLERHLGEVIDPKKASDEILAELANLELNLAAATQLLALSRGMRVHTKTEHVEAKNLSSGESELVYKVEHTDASGHRLRVPQAFIIQLPIFRNGEVAQLAVFLRYEQTPGRPLQWQFSLHHADRAFDEMFQVECEAAAKNTELPLYYGTPEA